MLVQVVDVEILVLHVELLENISLILYILVDSEESWYFRVMDVNKVLARHVLQQDVSSVSSVVSQPLEDAHLSFDLVLALFFSVVLVVLLVSHHLIVNELIIAFILPLFEPIDLLIYTRPTD